jgi:hypothetical protein
MLIIINLSCLIGLYLYLGESKGIVGDISKANGSTLRGNFAWLDNSAMTMSLTTLIIMPLIVAKLRIMTLFIT